jgi:hypothetical protein
VAGQCPDGRFPRVLAVRHEVGSAIHLLAAISDVGFSGDTCRSPGHEQGDWVPPTADTRGGQ